MSSRATTPATPRRPRTRAGPVRPQARRPAPVAAVAQPLRRLELDTLALGWQRALDAGERALLAAAESLPARELAERRLALARERQETARMLAAVAQATGIRPLPWLPPARVSVEMLGLPATTRACVFDLDGVLTDSGLLHAWAWGEVFDAFLLDLSHQTDRQFVPFDRASDYRAYIDGRSRLEGIRAFLDSRGIRVPEGRQGDPPRARTAWSLARRKGETTEHALRRRGVTALPAARRYLEAAGHAGLKRAVLSASASTLPMLELAALATLVEARVDADVLRAEDLHTPPAPDLLLAACLRLGVPPERTVAFTSRAAGVAAGLSAGVTVIGVGEGADDELLRGFGAPQVVPSLGALLDRRLLDGAGGRS